MYCSAQLQYDQPFPLITTANHRRGPFGTATCHQWLCQSATRILRCTALPALQCLRLRCSVCSPVHPQLRACPVNLGIDTHLHLFTHIPGCSLNVSRLGTNAHNCDCDSRIHLFLLFENSHICSRIQATAQCMLLSCFLMLLHVTSMQHICVHNYSNDIMLYSLT